MNIPTFLRGTNEQNQVFFEEMFQTLRQGLGPNGFQVSQQTTANINYMIDMTTGNIPPLPIGTVWFNTDLLKLQVLTVAALPGISSGTVETVTST